MQPNMRGEPLSEKDKNNDCVHTLVRKRKPMSDTERRTANNLFSELQENNVPMHHTMSASWASIQCQQAGPARNTSLTSCSLCRHPSQLDQLRSMPPPQFEVFAGAPASSTNCTQIPCAHIRHATNVLRPCAPAALTCIASLLQTKSCAYFQRLRRLFCT